MSFVYWFVGCSSTSSLGSVSFFTVNASPINSGTAAVTVVGWVVSGGCGHRACG